MPHRILILTAGFGEGHNTAARNIREGLEIHPAAPEIITEDAFAKFCPRINKLFQKSYAFAINNVPDLWKALYHLADDYQGKALNPWYLRTGLASLIEQHKPHSVVATHPLYLPLFEEIYPDPATQPFSLFTMVTDSTSIHPLWTRYRSDRLFVTDESSRAAVVAAGVQDHKVTITGFPVDLRFQTDRDTQPELETPGTPPRVLFLPTTRTGHVKKTLRHLVPWCQENSAQLTCVLGRNKARLGGVVEKETADLAGAIVEGWTDQLPVLLHQNHVVLTKAGGAITHEAIAARCPPLIHYVVPGQEEGNAKLITDHQCGLHVQTLAQIPDALQRLCLDANYRKECRDNLAALALPCPARRIAAEIAGPGQHLSDEARRGTLHMEPGDSQKHPQ